MSLKGKNIVHKHDEMTDLKSNTFYLENTLTNREVNNYTLQNVNVLVCIFGTNLVRKERIYKSVT